MRFCAGNTAKAVIDDMCLKGYLSLVCGYYFAVGDWLLEQRAIDSRSIGSRPQRILLQRIVDGG